MSTRATYSFEHPYLNKQVNFYIHSDNYPEGAAVYFWEMHKNKDNVKGFLPETFIKANLSSVEFSDGHDRHGDTEYQYHIDKQGILTAKKLKNWDARQFKDFFKEHYVEFINQHEKFLKECFPDFQKLHQVNIGYASRNNYMALSEVKAEVVRLYELVLSGYAQYKNDHEHWEAEYRRFTAIN
jgi:hypothetical protein